MCVSKHVIFVGVDTSTQQCETQAFHSPFAKVLQELIDTRTDVYLCSIIQQGPFQRSKIHALTVGRFRSIHILCSPELRDCMYPCVKWFSFSSSWENARATV